MRYKVGNTTMRMLITKDLKRKSGVVTIKNQISKHQKETRLSRCSMLINRMKSNNNGNKVHIFFDEKLFTVASVLNRRNNRYISGDRSEPVDPAVNPRRHKGGGVMQRPMCFSRIAQKRAD